MTTMIDKIAWIEVQDRRFLSTRSRGRTLFYIPGGKREPGESDAETLVREVLEEVSVCIDPASIKPFGVFVAPSDPHVHSTGAMVRMTCFSARYSGVLQPSNEIEELRWLDSGGSTISSPVDRLIIAEMIARGLID